MSISFLFFLRVKKKGYGGELSRASMNGAKEKKSLYESARRREIVSFLFGSLFVIRYSLFVIRYSLFV